MTSARARCRIGLVLACTAPVMAVAGPAASVPRAGASAACTVHAASAPVDAGRASSKLRHVPDEDDPCADSRGLGRRFEPLHPLVPGPALPSSAASSAHELGKQKP